MLISRIEIENFRSIGNKISLTAGPRLTALAGPNNSGKSNILRAISLFFRGEIEPGTRFAPKRDLSHLSGKKAGTIRIDLAFDRTADKQFVPKLEKSLKFPLPSLVVPITLSCYQNGNTQYAFTGPRNRKFRDDASIKLIQDYVDCTYIPAIKDYRTIINSEMMKKIVGATFAGWGRGILLSKKLGKHKDDFKKVLDSLQGILDTSGEFVSGIVGEAIPRIKKFQFALPYTELEEFLGKLDFKISEEGIPSQVSLDGEGSGMQSFTIYTMLRLLHELRPRATWRKSRSIWLIEEPETFMHHDLQRKTFEKLQQFGSDGQILISTHSPLFIDKESFGFSYYVSNTGQTAAEPITAKTVRQVIAGGLGVRLQDFLPFKRFNVFVEGETDRDLLLGINSLVAAAGGSPILDTSQVEIIACQGANTIPHFVQLYYPFSRYASFLGVFDRDKAGQAARSDLLNKKAYSPDDFLLIPQAPHKADAAIEDIVDKKIWDRCLQKLDDESLVSLKTQKGRIVGYEFDRTDREKVKKRFTALLLGHAKRDLNQFSLYRQLLEALAGRCSSGMTALGTQESTTVSMSEPKRRPK